jgi:hypothetical protein
MLTFSIVTAPENGTLGDIKPINTTAVRALYTPNPNNIGKDEFTFTVDSGRTDSKGIPVGGLGAIVKIDVIPDSNGLTVVSTDPIDGKTEVHLNQIISAVFNEPVQSSTVSTNTFTLQDSAGKNIPGTVSLSQDDKTATFTPSSPLEGSQTYKATINTGSTESLVGLV